MIDRVTSRRVVLSGLGVLLAAAALHSFDLAYKRDASARSDDCLIARGWPVTVRTYRQAEGLDAVWVFVFVATRPDDEEVAFVIERPYAEPTDADWREAREVFDTLEAMHT